MIDVTPEVYSVYELNNYIKSLFENDFSLNCVAVEGEISNFKAHTSGHWYLTLKDEKSSLRAVMFKGQNFRVRFAPENGMKVLAVGRVSVFDRDGTYQLYINDMMPVGAGDLAMAFEQLKTKLAAEGLFSEAHKKPLPKYPKRVGVVTAATGAAIEDILKVLTRRWPLAEVVLSPSLVQGAEAPPSIIAALQKLDASGECDVIIVGRGGGSLEDLWCFNDERVARAVYACQTPVISGVGHEPDVTIIDYVADRRAPTPSAAAELAVPDREAELQRVNALLGQAEKILGGKLDYQRLYTDRLLGRMSAAVETGLQKRRTNYAVLSQKVTSFAPLNLIGRRREEGGYIARKLKDAEYRILSGKRNELSVAAAKLDSLSPLKVLGRGYSIAESEKGIIRSVNDVTPGDRIKIKVNDGTIRAEVL